MTSRLYECQVTHARFAPERHRFSYRIFMLAVDLDELPELDRGLRLFSHDRRGVYSLREADYLPVSGPAHNPTEPARANAPRPSSAPDATPARPPLKVRALALLAARGVVLPADTRVELVTLPRVLGYLFNPVSFYFFRDASGACLAAIAEVTNTFREVKPYVLGPDNRIAAESSSHVSANETPLFHLRVPKHFYVSPFSDVDVAFDFRLRPPGEKLSVRIDDYAGAERTLASVLVGSAAPLTDRRLAWFSLKYPLLTLRVIALIHWHALRLYLKKIPWFPKAARPADQRDLYRPHASLSHRPSSSSAP